METQFFFLGILATIMVIFIIQIIISGQKLFKLERKNNELHGKIYDTNYRIDSLDVNFDQRLENLYRHIDSRVDKLEDKFKVKIQKSA